MISENSSLFLFVFSQFFISPQIVIYEWTTIPFWLDHIHAIPICRWTPRTTWTRPGTTSRSFPWPRLSFTRHTACVMQARVLMVWINHYWKQVGVSSYCVQLLKVVGFTMIRWWSTRRAWLGNLWRVASTGRYYWGTGSDLFDITVNYMLIYSF